MKVDGCVCLDGSQPFEPAVLSRSLIRLRLQLHARSGSQDCQGFAEIDVLALHHEGEDVAAGRTGAETVPVLAVWKHHERGRLLVMERTQPLIGAARLLKLHVRGHHIDDVQAVLDLVDNSHRSAWPSPGAIIWAAWPKGKRNYTRAKGECQRNSEDAAEQRSTRDYFARRQPRYTRRDSSTVMNAFSSILSIIWSTLGRSARRTTIS